MCESVRRPLVGSSPSSQWVSSSLFEFFEFFVRVCVGTTALETLMEPEWSPNGALLGSRCDCRPSVTHSPDLAQGSHTSHSPP